jgi:hypothetical protein
MGTRPASRAGQNGDSIMMPTYRLTATYPSGQQVITWTQDPEGLAASYRDAGAFVSTDVPREDAPRS